MLSGDNINAHLRAERSNTVNKANSLKLVSLLFADGVVLFASSDCEPKLAIRGLAAKCEVTGIRSLRPWLFSVKYLQLFMSAQVKVK